MITLFILNFIIDVVNRWIFFGFNFLIQPLTTATNYISSFTVPQTLLDVMALAYYFLPMGTIFILLNITILIIVIKTVMAVIHVLSAGIAFGE